MQIQSRHCSPRSNEANRRGRLLIVDGNLTLLDHMAEHFRTLGYEVDAAAECEEAEALLSNYKYSLVITDVVLSRIGFRGLNLLDYTSDMYERPKIVVVTEHTDADIQMEATARGIDMFLPKPVRLCYLTEVTERLLGATG